MTVVVRHRQCCMTGAGWCCLWDAAAFTHVTDEHKHFAALIDDDALRSTLAAGGLVPVCDFSDGGYEIGLSWTDDTEDPPLSAADCAFAIASSRPYAFSTTGAVYLTGMEFVGHPPPRSESCIKLPPGEYVATVYRYDPASELPEFLVALTPRLPENEGITFCTDIDTFAQNPPVLPTGHIGLLVHTCQQWRSLKEAVMQITGHDKIGVSVMKDHRPVYLGNGYQDWQRIEPMLQPLVDAVNARQGTFDFVLDEQPIAPAALRQQFATTSGT